MANATEIKKRKSNTRKEFDKANGATRFVVIKLANLPDDCPVLAVNQFFSKSFAEFHLVDNVLVPETATEIINIDIESRKPKTNNHG
jgi:hypothetical protein